MVSTDYCTAATAPKSQCSAHAMYRICKESGCLAGPNCPDDVVEELSLAVVNGQIVNRPSKESCAESGKIYVDISQTCSLTEHKTSESQVPSDVVIGGDNIPDFGDPSWDGHIGNTNNNTSNGNHSNSNSNGGNSNGNDSDGQEFVIGAN